MSSSSILRRGLSGLSCLLVLLGLSAVVHADPLQFMPADTEVAVVFRDPQNFSDRLSRLLVKRGLDKAWPGAADPLGFLQDTAGVQKGFNPNGELGFAVWMQPKGPVPFDIMVLVPVTDYAAFLGNFPDKKTEGEITTVTATKLGNEVSVRKFGEYAVIATDPARLKKRPEGLKITGTHLAELRKMDVFTCTVAGAQRAQMDTMIEMLKAQSGQEIESLQKTPEGKQFAAVTKALTDAMINSFQSIIHDQAYTLQSINLEKDGGLRIITSYEFGATSGTGKALASMPSTDEPLTAGLPKGNYIAAGGWMRDPAGADKRLESLLAESTRELGKVGEEGKAGQQMVSAARDGLAGVSRLTWGVAMPTDKAGKPQPVSMLAVATGDAPRMSRGMQKVLDTSRQLSKAPAVAKPIASQLGGVKFDVYPLPSSDKTEQVFPGAVAVAQVDAQHLLAGAGTDDATLAAAVTATKTNRDTLGEQPGIRAVNDLLPKKRMAVFYVWVGEIVAAAKAHGEAAPFEIDRTTPPAAMSFTTGGPCLRVDTVAPPALVDAMIQGIVSLVGGNKPERF